MTFTLNKCFAIVFNSRTKKPEDLPTFIFRGTKTNPCQLATFYPDDAPDLWLGIKITDHVSQIKLDSSSTLPCALVPNYRRKPNSGYLKLIKSKFARARHGTSKLCPDVALLTPIISTRLYKTLVRSTLLYAIEFADWDVDQIQELETKQAKALRSCLNSDLQCPQALIRLFSGVEPFEARRDLHILLYYGKLSRYEPASFPSKVHRVCTSRRDKPVGFHCTVFRILQKYGLEHYWDNIPDFSNERLKVILKKHIWIHHWNNDVASARLRDSPFSTIILKDAVPPTHPYKTHHFIGRFITLGLPRQELTSVLRFWMTPCRQRFCSCNFPTCNLAKHLTFDCPRTSDLMASYRRSLLPNLSSTLHPNSFSIFLSRIADSVEDFNSFNRVIGKFDYPLF